MRYRTPVLLALVAATLILYLQCGWHDFIILDDQLYVTKNPAIQGGLSWEGIKWAFSLASTQTSGNWHPVTWISHMLDIQLFKMSPMGHHLTNVFLHASDVGLLFLLLCAATGALWPSAAVAAVFALHPLHVESVAWVAERKDVLSAFFWMLTLLLYLRYLRRPGAGRYLLTLAAFVLGLMAKPMLVSLPLVMLMLDYWPLRRISWPAAGGEPPVPLKGLLLEKVPFVAVTALFCGVAIYAQHQGGYVPGLDVFPMSMRLYNALLAYQGYLFKTLWPVGLGVYYPFPVVHSIFPALGALLLVGAISVFALFNCRRRPYLLVGWLWFLVTLVPVIGLIQVGHQSMADRYMYLPIIGLAIMAAWGIPDFLPAPLRRPPVLAGFCAALFLACSALTWHQLGYWRDSKTLLTRTLDVTSGNYYAHSLLGNYLFQQGNYLEALPHYQAAVAINPTYEIAHYKIGLISMMTGDIDSAIRHLSAALQLAPNSERSANARVSLNRCLEFQRGGSPN